VENSLLAPPEAIKQPSAVPAKRFWPNCVSEYCLIAVAVLVLGAAAALGTLYVHYARIADEKLKIGPFASTDNIYAAPELIRPRELLTQDDLVARFRRAGADPTPANAVGWFRAVPDGVEFHPGPQSVTASPAVLIPFRGGRIAQIQSLADRRDLTEYLLEPVLITAVSEQNREKRRLVKFHDIPSDLVNAVVSAEDKRFFQHRGFDPLRIVKAAWVDFRTHRKGQGASTISMQLARNLWLDSDKSWRRKFEELMIAMRVEEKLSKEEIFEDYCNQVYLGRSGAYSMHGFGAASETFFGKEIRQLSLPEAATLAGLIQRPSYFSPVRNPERAIERRNLVLLLMRQNGYISNQAYETAVKAPLQLTARDGEAAEAPYFIDLVNDEIQTDLSDSPLGQTRVYATLDLNLQRAAVEAVRIGMQNVDKLLSKRHRNGMATLPAPQVALVAMDPHTGEVKALIGGRNYTASQLNRALAKRQPGSVFKPFVYAAALNTAVAGGSQVLTPATIVTDEPTTFEFGGKEYAPANFGQEFYGNVMLRTALAHSLNVATVKVAEMVGYNAVVQMAQRAGLTDNLQPTPALALGSYEETPLEIAGAYTVFANEGTYVKPRLLSTIRDRTGTVVYYNEPDKSAALDPRVAYLMVDMLQEVMRTGTAAGVRGRGFTAPAAGKTGTSHDGWFAGFTSNLLCVVWVGFDDNRELKLEGAKSALPIWTEFMKRAVALYPDVKPFTPPSGIVSAEICGESGALATPMCPQHTVESFIAGTQPEVQCALHSAAASTIPTPQVEWAATPQQN